MPGSRLRLEDKSIGPVEAEMPDLLCSDPIGERTALYAMHHYALLRVDLERSPVTEVRPPSLGCFFSARPKEILTGEPCGATDGNLCRHAAVGLIEDQTQRSIPEWLRHLTGRENMFEGDQTPRPQERFGALPVSCFESVHCPFDSAELARSIPLYTAAQIFARGESVILP